MPVDVCDVCDACGVVESYIRAIKLIDILRLCGHHGTEHGPALTEAGWMVQDTRKPVTT